MKKILLPIGLFLLVVLPLTANDLKDRSGPKAREGHNYNS